MAVTTPGSPRDIALRPSGRRSSEKQAVLTGRSHNKTLRPVTQSGASRKPDSIGPWRNHSRCTAGHSIFRGFPYSSASVSGTHSVPGGPVGSLGRQPGRPIAEGWPSPAALWRTRPGSLRALGWGCSCEGQEWDTRPARLTGLKCRTRARAGLKWKLEWGQCCFK